MSDYTTSYFGMALDPLHVGAGGYRLGRVDNTIIRDPGSNLPKIPGSSIAGVCRNYSIYGLMLQEDVDKARQCATHDDFQVKNNCGKCVICQTYGFASGKDKVSQVGKVKFFDASIVAFPVSTIIGPVWITTFSILNGMGLKPGEHLQPSGDEVVIGYDLPGENPHEGRINLGWLYFSARRADSFVSLAGEHPLIEMAKERLTIVPEWLFPELVNNNLEVRTSVSIDFDTGAAETGKLFTYEAIPRGTVMSFDVVVDGFRCTEQMPAEKVKEIVSSGLSLFESLGLGGMNTRGFGRLSVEPCQQTKE